MVVRGELRGNCRLPVGASKDESVPRNIRHGLVVVLRTEAPQPAIFLFITPLSAWLRHQTMLVLTHCGVAVAAHYIPNPIGP